jgi:hypothetical protein
VGQYRERKIHQIDPETGAILRTIESNRFVTGVTWVEGSCGTGPGRVTRAIFGESIPRRGRCWRRSICRPGSTCRGSSPMVAIGSSVEGERAGRSEPCDGHGEAPRSAVSAALPIPAGARTGVARIVTARPRSSCPGRSA